ncbi:hypothetical protein JCM10212_006569 [Sporobolomyces blumeae]
MYDTIRDAPLGQILNWASNGRLCPYPDQRPGYEVNPRYLVAPAVPPAEQNRSEPTLVGDRRSKSNFRDSLSVSMPLSEGSTGDIALDTYNSRKAPGERTSPVRSESRSPDGRTEATHVDSGEPAVASPRSASLAGSTHSVDSATREKREWEHWTKRMMKDPKLAKQEGMEDDYEYLVTWDGDDDPENPKCFSKWKKIWVSFQICLVTFSVYAGASLITASETGIQQQFGVSQTVSVLTLSLYIAGYGIGPMLWSPLQETPQIGRTPIYIVTLFLFVLFQLPIVLAPNFATILVFRFLTGFMGSPALGGGGASLCDLYDSLHIPYALGVWAMAAVCGPIISPVIGGFAAMNENWRWPVYELIWASGFSLLITFLFLPETYGPTILYKRAVRLRKLTGNDKLITREELDMQDEPSFIKTLGTTVGRAFALCSDPVVFFCNLYLAFVYALFYLWFESFPILYQDRLGYNAGVSGLPFLGFYVSGAISFVVYVLYQRWHYIPKLLKTNFKVPPEERLELCLMGAPWIGIALLTFGWTGNNPTTWVGPTIGAALYFPGVYYLFQCLSVYLCLSYEKYAASILAGSGLFRALLAAGFPIFGRAFFSNLGIGPASTLLAGISFLLIIPLYFLYKYGDRLRARSRWCEAKD